MYLHPNLIVFHFIGRLLALATNIRLVSNTPAYYDIATIMAVKSFIIQAPGITNVMLSGTFYSLCFVTLCCWNSTSTSNNSINNLKNVLNLK